MNDDDAGRLRAYLDHELDANARAQLERELAGSAQLRAELAAIEALDRELSLRLHLDAPAPDLHAAWRAIARRHPTEPERRWPRWAALAAAAVFALGVGAMATGGHAQSGRRTVDARESIEIGDHAKAVAEAGSAIAWDIDDDGDVRVRQSAGAVFYRVDRGDAFVVETPAGHVSVAGTCFTVEVLPLSSKLKHLGSAGAGAIISAGVFLSVQEGQVVLANDRGSIELAAGESAHAWGDRAPLLDDDTGDASGGAIAQSTAPNASPYASLVRENAEQRRALRALEEQLDAVQASAGRGETSIEEQGGPEARRAAAKDCAEQGTCAAHLWTDPSHDDLVELARCGRLLFDTPEFVFSDHTLPDGAMIEAAGLSEGDAARFSAAASALRDDVARRLRGLVAELELPAELVDRLSLPQLYAVLDAVVDEGLRADVRRRVAAERAGLATAPTEQSAGERMLRLQFELGTEFESRLAAELGAEAAHEIRGANQGWPNKTSLGGGDCADAAP